MSRTTVFYHCAEIVVESIIIGWKFISYNSFCLFKYMYEVYSKKRLNFCNKNFINVLTTLCMLIPFKCNGPHCWCLSPASNGPLLTFHQILEPFLQCNFWNGVQLFFHIFVDLLCCFKMTSFQGHLQFWKQEKSGE